MKRGSLLTMVLLMLLALAPLMLGADETTLRYESVIIETWDGADSTFYSDTGDPVSWQLRGSKFSAEGYPRMAYAMNEWPTDLFGTTPDDPESLGIFGINGAFDRQGYNQIEMIPGVGEGEDWFAKPIPLPGRVQMMDFWVWGANYDYYVEFHFLDHQGIAHTLIPVRAENQREAGSIKFIGWKNMYVDMPGYIRQAVSYKPSLATLSLSKIVFTTHPAEMVDDFYIYIDHLKVLTDQHESFYDGFDLTDTARIDEIWGSGE